MGAAIYRGMIRCESSPRARRLVGRDDIHHRTYAYGLLVRFPSIDDERGPCNDFPGSAGRRCAHALGRESRFARDDGPLALERNLHHPNHLVTGAQKFQSSV